MTSIMNTHFFEQFCHLKTVTAREYTIFQNFGDNSNDEYLTTAIDKIMNSKNQKLLDINMARFRFALSELANKNREVVCQLVINALNKATKSFNTTLQNMINNKTYNNMAFISMYNDYVINVNFLKNLLRPVSFVFETQNDNYKNVIFIYSNYLFYYNVINKQYDVDSQKYSLYNLFLKYWEKKNISELFALLKISNYFFVFSVKVFEHCSSDKNAREKFFNTELDSVLINSDETKSPEFLSEIISTINEIVRELNVALKQKDAKKDTEKQVKDLIDFVKYGSKICDKTQFMLNYYNNLMLRLEEGSNFKLEKKIQECIDSKYHPELYAKMIFCIKDIEDSNTITKILHSLPLCNIKFTSPKYKNIDPSMFNKDMCNYFLYRTYAWSQKNDIGTINLPVQLSYYTDIFMNLPRIKDKNTNHHLKYKKLFVDYERSNTTFEMKFNNNTYNFKATMLQSAILLTFVNHKSITAKKIAEELCISHLKHVSVPLNSLISIGLVVRPINVPANDPNIVFSINDKWYQEDKNIDLITVGKKIKEKMLIMKSGQQPKQLAMTQAEETKLKGDVIKYLSTDKKSEKLETITENVKNSVTNVKTVLDNLVEKNILNKNGDLYSFCCNNESSDSDSEEIEND